MAKSKSTSKHQVIREPLAAQGGEIVLYQAPDGSVKLDVRLERDTIWLSQKQMALLFDTERSVITKHLRNIFQSGELEEKSNVQKMHIPGSDKPVAFYSLDAIISVGYRVNSKRGTQFRIWATQVLRDHILRGYTVNERRLRELQQTIRLVSTLADRRALSGEEATGLLRVVHDYAVALKLLDDYDHGRIPLPRSNRYPLRAVGTSLNQNSTGFPTSSRRSTISSATFLGLMPIGCANSLLRKFRRVLLLTPPIRTLGSSRTNKTPASNTTRRSFA
jgi:hypothetical protein